ncbi:hypothetical protein GQ44DRAFT_802545 [Phaeosphaeriaceae sp. PMI808]|nr:hypothetical protein GQ44DRAFT_802545 [Phaeosphaeriaceae sp. PMI808]
MAMEGSTVQTPSEESSFSHNTIILTPTSSSCTGRDLNQELQPRSHPDIDNWLQTVLQYSDSQQSESQHPDSQHPDSQYPNYQHPDSQYPNYQHPDSQYPNYQHPDSQYPDSHPGSHHSLNNHACTEIEDLPSVDCTMEKVWWAARHNDLDKFKKNYREMFEQSTQC